MIQHPYGPVGPQYPEGFRVWYFIIVIGLLALGVWISP